MQAGQETDSGLPQPEQISWPFLTGRRQEGQRWPKGLPLEQEGQKRESGSMNAPQWMQGCL